MRRRITLTVVGVVAGALLVATVATFVLLRYNARRDTRRDLVLQAANLATRFDELQRPQLLNSLVAALRLEELRVLCIGTACRAPGQPPPGVTRADLDLAKLRAGATVSGHHGSLMYAAAGVPRTNEMLFVVVLTRKVETRFPAGLLVIAIGTLAVAAAVAANLGRRLTKPLREAQAATRRIAGGDLATRVPIVPDDGEELAGLAESINTMAAGLERSRGLERQFLLSVSHDLRTPLTSIRGYAEALAEGRTPDPAHAAGIILSESRRLERLVQDLLELAKLDARRFSLDVRGIDLGEVVADTAEGFRPAAEKAGVALEVRSNGLAAAVLAAADPDRLAQVVANLVENALKYARLSIEVGTEGVDLWVADDGPGISAEDLPHVFEPFYSSTRTPNRQVGSGLGLAIVRELVGAMGGTVRAEPCASGGTRMVVSLRSWTSAAGTVG